MENNSNKDFGKLLRKYGYAMPKSEDEVIAFEHKHKKDFETPCEWPSIEDIIEDKNKDVNNKVVQLNYEQKENKSISSLSMAAREGKEITDEIRKKMIKDKKNAKK